MTLIFEHERKLCAVSGFTGALKTAHHYDCRRMVRGIEACLCSAHKVRQLFVDNLNDHLRGRKTFHNLCADGAFGNGLCKISCNFIVNVRLKQSKADFPHGVFNVAFGERALAFKPLERGFKSFGKAFKCHCISPFTIIRKSF